MSTSKHIFFLMNHVFYGFAISVIYGSSVAFAIWILSDLSETTVFVDAYFNRFNCAISGGLIISASILIYKTQRWIPDLIESLFLSSDLDRTEYSVHKRRYFSIWNSVEFSSEFIILGFLVFYLAKFPFSGLPHYALLINACAQYGLGVYIGRKLFYVAQMLNAIEPLNVEGDIFSGDKLGPIITYVNSMSTLTFIFVFVHVYSFYHGPFLYNTPLGGSVRLALLLPAGIALPVVAIFNFYPRAVIKSIYSRSISIQIEQIKENLKNSKVTEYERLAYIIEYDKVTSDELKYRMRMTLSDLPLMLTIAATIASVFFSK